MPALATAYPDCPGLAYLAARNLMAAGRFADAVNLLQKGGQGAWPAEFQPLRDEMLWLSGVGLTFDRHDEQARTIFASLGMTNGNAAFQARAKAWQERCDDLLGSTPPASNRIAK
jgi:hypothetical protein